MMLLLFVIADWSGPPFSELGFVKTSLWWSLCGIMTHEGARQSPCISLKKIAEKYFSITGSKNLRGTPEILT